MFTSGLRYFTGWQLLVDVGLLLHIAVIGLRYYHHSVASNFTKELAKDACLKKEVRICPTTDLKKPSWMVFLSAFQFSCSNDISFWRVSQNGNIDLWHGDSRSFVFRKTPPKHLPLVQLPVHGRSVFEDSADALVLDIATFEAEAVAWSNFLLASCFMMVFLFAGLVQYLSALSFF